MGGEGRGREGKGGKGDGSFVPSVASWGRFW